MRKPASRCEPEAMPFLFRLYAERGADLLRCQHGTRRLDNAIELSRRQSTPIVPGGE
jgi:hypothetical protein